MGDPTVPRNRRAYSFDSTFLYPAKPTLSVKTHRDSLRTRYGSSKQPGKSIGWSDVFIRQFAITVGDNPSVSCGPPLSIDWIYLAPVNQMPIDEFENERNSRRSQSVVVLTREEREELLENVWNVPKSEIITAVRNTLKAKHQRRTTVENLGASTRLEEILESTGRKCKRALSFQSRPSVVAEELTRTHLAAVAQRKAMWESSVKGTGNPISTIGASFTSIPRPLDDERKSSASVLSSLPPMNKSSRQHPSLSESQDDNCGELMQVQGQMTPLEDLVKGNALSAVTAPGEEVSDGTDAFTNTGEHGELMKAKKTKKGSKRSKTLEKKKKRKSSSS